MFKRLMISLILLVLVIVPLSAQDDEAFELAPCPVEIPFGFVEDIGPNGIECGFVIVPEFHAEPDGNTIRLAVAVINSSNPNPAPDPVFIEQGGPGGSTIDLFLPFAPLFAQILAERDVVLVEQRGTLYSEPALMCPEVLEAGLDAISEDSFLTNFVVADGPYAACFDRLREEGVNFDAFNSLENAADMIAVADALGYDGQINFYGVSYGTMLGQHLLRDYEDRIRAIVFDAVAPLEVNFLANSLTAADDSLTELLSACELDELCNTLYPELETTLFDTVADLNDNPILVPIYDPETGETYDAFFNGDALMQFVRQLQYSSELVGSIPAFIDASANSDFEWAERLYGALAIAGNRTLAEAMYLSVMCAEDADFDEADYNVDGVRPELASLTDVLETLSDACDLLAVTELDDFVDDPVTSDVPALLTSGQFDPITPSPYADVLASNLSNATNLTFPGVGHGAILGGTCPVGIIASFFSDPEAELDTACIDSMSPTFIDLTIDPTGRLQYAVPVGMNDVSEDFARYENEAGDLTISFLTSDSMDLTEATQDVLEIAVREGFSTPPLQQIQQNSILGDTVLSVYQDGVDFIFAYSTTVEDMTAVIVMQFGAAQLMNVEPILVPLAANLYSVD